MTLGVMQPYLFPYLGYFQYVSACDRFVLYDDVQFTMRGWINRNRILLNGRAHLFTAPLAKASPRKRINEVEIARTGWEDTLLRTLAHAYRRAPWSSTILPLLDAVLRSGHQRIADLTRDSILVVSEYLGLDTTSFQLSATYGNDHLARNERLIDLCRREGADRCIVPIGGAALYPKDEFAREGIELSYLKAGLPEYLQIPGRPFVPALSIIDVLMFNDRGKARAMLDAAELS